MNIAQVDTSAKVTSAKSKLTLIDAKSFSEEFEKYYTSTAKKEKPLTTEDFEAEGLNEELSDPKEETDQEVELASFSLINPFLKLDSEVTDLKQTLEGMSLARLTNGTNSMSDSISQKVNADTALNDLSDEEQTFILHNEPIDNESNLFTENQANTIELQVKQDSKNSSIDTKPLTEISSQDQTEILTALSDFTQTLDANSLSTLVKEISEMMESMELNEAAKSSESELSPAIKEILETGKFEPIDPESLQKIAASLNEVLDTEKKTEQKYVNQPEVEQITQSAKKDTESLKQPDEERGKAQKTLSQNLAKSPDEQKSSQTVEMNRSRELQTPDVETEVTDKLVSVTSAKKEETQADTDHEFVSMLRQISTQSTKESSQVAAKSNTEASVTVPKEQSLNLIQDMVTSLAENKEGQKTYQTRLHLSPETLGKVTIELSLTEEGLSGKLTFQSDETRKWMEGEWLDLKLPLESKGVMIKSFDFTTSQPANQQQSGFSFSENPSQSEQESQKQRFSKNQHVPSAEKDEQMSEVNLNKKNGINVYV
ncbi:flagellar hook-length control protein FliK [Alkalibacterium sp. 20]|uniref:flagellar hook-length control protein FliK n=1 Tax=Alkalibacterium sp. 20 TaxID=1798803 RepID=UPI00090038CD|nr:flagellar hook-length control protein FliK [Alkalibacterium sp. 20]OJF90877.1 hypothetical protein AX762_03665 [Alkalibacterium sp. 20]